MNCIQVYSIKCLMTIMDQIHYDLACIRSTELMDEYPGYCCTLPDGSCSGCSTATGIYKLNGHTVTIL